MLNLTTRLTTLLLVALMLALPTVGCQQKAHENEKENQTEKVNENEKEKVLDVEVNGKTKVNVERSKRPEEKRGHIDVEVEHPAGHESGGPSK
jgi:hypothetical protein